MSWSVSAVGTPAEVRGFLSEQFKGPLAEKPYGLYNDSERETVRRIQDLIEQTTSTFDPEKALSVYVHGHIEFSDWGTRTGAFQYVDISIEPYNQVNKEP